MPKFREITGQFVGYVPDGTDTDVNPDRETMNGRVTFTPVFTGGVIAYPELSPPEFAHPEPISARIIDGFVQVRVGTDDDVSMQPLSLMVTVDDEASQVWSWRAEFTNMRIGDGEVEVQIPAWSFRVPDGVGPVDLTELVPLKSGSSVDVTKGPRGAGLQNITAIDGQLVFEYTDGEEATIAIPEAVQGPQGEPGPAGADGVQGPEGPQGPAGEIPDLLVSNISDATPTGKNLMLAATEGAARSALGLAAGATAINGALSELENGVSNNPRVWTPANIATFVGGVAENAADSVKTAVNVKDFGAAGDGTTDETNSIQQALNHLDALGGGTLFFPEGRYWAKNNVVLKNNVEITGKSATLVKIPGQDTRYAYFVSRSGPNQGYGSGVENVYVHDIAFEGDLSLGGSCAFGLHHARNVTVERCSFISMMKTGHVFDLNGCDGITVRDCEFAGFSPTTSGYYRAESIQVDISMPGAASTPDDDMSWDGLPTVNVLVEGCKFLPLTWKGVEYFAPNAVGSHAERQGAWHENITIRNCVMVHPYPDNGSSPTSGSIHFVGARNINISDNVFVSNTGSVRVMGFYGATTVTAADSPVTPGTTPTTVDLEGGLGCHNVTIRGNIFRGYTANTTGGGNPVVFGKTGGGGGIRHTGIVIDGNTAEYSGGAQASNVFHVSGCVNLTISNNVVNGPARLVQAASCERVAVSSNFMQGARSDAIRFEGVSSEVSISGNVSISPAGSSIYLLGTVAAMVSNNSIKGSAGGARDIAVNGCTSTALVGNTIAARVRGIEIYGASSKTSVVGNVITAASEAAIVDGGTDTVSLGNVVA